jgi:hypothetical protein
MKVKLGYLLEPCIEICWFFENLGRNLLIENLKKAPDFITFLLLIEHFGYR